MKNMQKIMLITCSFFCLGQLAFGKPIRQSESKPAEDVFDAVWQEMEQDMQASIERSRKALKKIVAQEQFAQIPACGKVAVAETEQNVVVTIPSLELKSVDTISIVREDGVAHVKVPLKHGEIAATIDERTLDVSARCLVEQKQKGNDGKEMVVDSKSSEYSTFVSLPARVDINSIKAEYGDKTLKLIFAKKDEK